MSLSLGIVGLPNVGKSTLFNALTRNNVLAANYPFATIEPNEGVVPLPDARLARLAEMFGSERILAAPVTFVDIAGIVKGASEGAGLGNKFLANIRECDAICQVVRVFADDDVVHVDGKVDPRSDIEVIETELMIADMQTLEKAVPRLEKEARNNKDRKAVHEAAVAAQAVLDSGTTLFAAGSKVDSALLRELNLLTTKPFLYVFNADESVLGDDAKIAELRALVAPADAVFLDAKIESELQELDDESAAELLESIGQHERGQVQHDGSTHAGAEIRGAGGQVAEFLIKRIGQGAFQFRVHAIHQFIGAAEVQPGADALNAKMILLIDHDGDTLLAIHHDGAAGRTCRMLATDQVALHQHLFADLAQVGVVLAVAITHFGQILDHGACFFEQFHTLTLLAKSGKRIAPQITRQTHPRGHDDLGMWACALHPVGGIFDQCGKAHHRAT